MKTPEEFESYLAETLLPDLEQRKREVREIVERRNALRLPFSHKVAFWVGALSLAMLFKPLFHAFWLAVVLPFVVDHWRMRRIPLPAVDDTKRAFVERVVEFHDPSFDYAPAAHISREEFEASRLFHGIGRIDRFAGEDLVKGKVGATAFRFSELRVQRRHGHGKEVRYETLFSGLFLVADFNKRFGHPLYVLPDTAEKHFGMAARAIQSLRSGGYGDLVQLEDPVFESHFKVYGRDPVEARYILSPSLMRRLVRFRETTNDEVRLAFVDGCVSVALPLPGDLFHVRSVLDLDLPTLRSWATDLAFATGIIEELDLDTRIWSKA